MYRKIWILLITFKFNHYNDFKNYVHLPNYINNYKLMQAKKSNIIIIFLLVIFFFTGIYVILNTQNSFGGADNIAHYFAAHYGWKYPKLLFDHWSKPVFTILSSPFAQFGINGIRIYNLLLGLAGGYFAYRTSNILGVKSAFISLIFCILAPVYFILMFTSLTEISFAFFITLGVYLFFSEKIHWSAIVISFIPIIRTEGVILLPLFALAYGLKKSYISIPLLAFGFVLISLLGFPFHDNFFWLITEMPYGGTNIYGSGHWFHFINNTKNIMGFLVLTLFLISLIMLLLQYFRKGIFKFENEFYILLLIFAPFILYFTAHSYVWAMGKGGSLGLIRVIGAVIPLAAIGASFSFDKAYIYLQKKNKFIAYVLILIITIFMFDQSKHIYKWAFYPSSRDKLMQETADYIKNNNLNKNHLVYYDVNVIYELGRDPYDNTKTSWMIANRKSPSMPFPDSTIIVWDSHFGNNEGQMPLKNLTNDPKLVLLKKIAPEIPQKTLGGYDYEIDIFQKITPTNRKKLNHYYNDFSYETKIENEDSICASITSNMEYAPGLSVSTSDICNRFEKFNIQVSFDIKKNTQKAFSDLILVLSIENGKNYFYRPMDISNKIKAQGEWEHIEFQYNNIGVSPGKEVLKIYIWNKGKNEFLLDNFGVDFRTTDL